MVIYSKSYIFIEMQNMIKKVQHLLKTDDYKRLYVNFFSLSLLQGVNYLLPLITFPYIVRVIGAEKYGLLAFANATITYFMILTDYGFNLSATRKIAIHRNDQEKIVEIFSTVLSIQIVLMLISFLMMTIIIFGLKSFRNDWVIYFFTFGIVLGQVFFPIWFFQGMEQMKYITLLNLLTKSIFTISIFVFVTQENDFYKIPMLNSIGTVFTGAVTIALINKKFDIHFKLQPFNKMLIELKDGWYIFTSRVFVSLYTTTNIFLLGIMTNNLVVGYYSIADRIISISCRVFSILNQTVYPYMSRLKENNFEAFISFFLRLIKLIVCLSLFLFLVLYLCEDQILDFLIKDEIDKCISSIYIILLFTVFTNPFGPFFTQTLLILKMDKEFNNIVKTTFVYNIILTPCFIYFFSGKGLAVNTFISQVFVILLCYFFINKGLKSCKHSSLMK
jgi:PST family polysaccharide transporter